MLRISFICVVLVLLAKRITPTIITAQPTNTSAIVGQNAYITCLVSNKGQDKVKWVKGLQQLTADSISVLNNRYVVSGVNLNYNLSITAVTLQDEGQYSCQVGDNGAGQPTDSRTASLTIVALPTNISVFWSTPPVPGRIANLTCRATYGRPPPTLMWYKDEIPYNQYAPTISTANFQGYGDASSTLQLTLTVADEGKRFRCQADYPGLARAQEATIITRLTNDSTTVKACIMTMLLPILMFLY